MELINQINEKVNGIIWGPYMIFPEPSIPLRQLAAQQASRFTALSPWVWHEACSPTKREWEVLP